MIEIWLRGKKLCELKEEEKEVLKELEQIINKAGYTIETIKEGDRIIIMV